MATLLQLRTLVRDNLGDAEGAQPQRWSSSKINGWINEGYLYYSQMLVNNGAGDLGTATVPFNIVANQIEYDLTAIFGQMPVHVRLVQRLYSTIWYTLQPQELVAGTQYAPGYASGTWFPTYRFRGKFLVFNQLPNFSEAGTVRAEAYLTPVELSADGDQPDPNFYAITQRLLVLYATVAALESKEAMGMTGDVDAFRERWNKHESLFVSTIMGRTDTPGSVTPFVMEGSS